MNSIIKFRAKLADFGLSKIVHSGKSRRVKAGMSQVSELSKKEKIEIKKAGRSVGWVKKMRGYVGTWCSRMLGERESFNHFTPFHVSTMPVKLLGLRTQALHSGWHPNVVWIRTRTLDQVLIFSRLLL